MDTLFARYFDGELGDREAQDFLEAVEANPSLEKELRAYEQVLALGKKLSAPAAPQGFTERVMSKVRTGGEPVLFRWRTAFFGSRLTVAAVAASAVLIAFTGGWWFAAHSNRPMGTAPASYRMAADTQPQVLPVFANQSAGTENGYRYVRLVYVPNDPAVHSVRVAGNFNGWDPGSTPMRRQDGVWSTMLVLPPGSYEYMFVVDEKQWVTDPLAVETRDDGFGGQNAVLDVEL